MPAFSPFRVPQPSIFFKPRPYQIMDFKLKSDFDPRGDQPRAIEKLTQGLKTGKKDQVLLGVTGSGKTFTISNVINKIQKPALVISHNKTLAAQLFQEFREFFPKNAVHYFVSYYDYYQPEAYIPTTDTYIEKDASINEAIDRLRHGATQSVLSRQDTIVIASVSCIYGIGSPAEYKNVALRIKEGQKISQRALMEKLVDLQYQRNQKTLERSNFRRRANAVEIVPAFSNEIIRIEFKRKKIEKITRQTAPYLQAGLDSGKDSSPSLSPEEQKDNPDSLRIWPAKHYTTPKEKLKQASKNIRKELQKRVKKLKKEGKAIEAQRLQKKTTNDLEMLRETGYCKGIENYSRHLSFRKPGEPPLTLVDYFNYNYDSDWLMIIDESHMSIPQIKGMYKGDSSRKKTLIEHGFRLPSAKDNRPLKFNEFQEKMPQTLYMSATPGDFELKRASGNILKTLPQFEKIAHKKTDLSILKEKGRKKFFERKKGFSSKKLENFYADIEGIIEQLIRPTGLLDPEIELRSPDNQIENLVTKIKKTAEKNQRALVTTITQNLAENIADYLEQEGINALWLHAEVPTLERPDILKKLRKGEVEAVVGINLLREGIDLPEVSLVAILDADKEGFLRNETTLIQTMGRAARHPEGKVIMYAEKETKSMKNAIFETKRRRAIQQIYNKKNNITPTQITKPIRENVVPGYQADTTDQKKLSFKDKAIEDLKKEMKEASENLSFEKAARLRDKIEEIEQEDQNRK